MSSPHDSAEPDQPDFSSFSPQDLNAEDEFGRDPMEPGAPVGRIDDEHMEPEEPVWSPPAAGAQPARSPMEPEDPVFVAPVASPPKPVPTPKKKSGLGKAILVGTLAVLLLAGGGATAYWFWPPVIPPAKQGEQVAQVNTGNGQAPPIVPATIENQPPGPPPSKPALLEAILDKLRNPTEDAVALRKLEDELDGLDLSVEESSQVAAAASEGREKCSTVRFRGWLRAIESMYQTGSDKPDVTPTGASKSDSAETAKPSTPTEFVPRTANKGQTPKTGMGPFGVLFPFAFLQAEPDEHPKNWDNLGMEKQNAWDEANATYADKEASDHLRAESAKNLAEICFFSGDVQLGLKWCDRAGTLRPKLLPERQKSKWQKTEDDVASLRSRLYALGQEQLAAQTSTLLNKLTKAEEELNAVKTDAEETKKIAEKNQKDADTKITMLSTEVDKVRKNLAGSLQAIEVLRKAGTDFLNTSKLDARLKNAEPKKPTSTAASVQQEYERRHKQWEDDQRQLGEIQQQLGDKASKAETMALANLQLMEILYHALQAENSPVATPSVGGSGGDLTATVVNLVSREVAAQLDPLLRAEQKSLQSQLNAAQSNLMAEIGRTGKLNAAQVDGLRTEVRNEFARLKRDVPGLPDDQLARVSESVVGNVLNELARYGYVPPKVPAGAKPPAVPRDVPSNPLAARECFAKAYNAYFQNDSAMAAQQLSLAITLDPTEAIYRYYMGLVLYRQGRVNEAVAQVRTGAALEAGSEYNRNSSAAGLQRIQGPTRRWLELAKSGI